MQDTININDPSANVDPFAKTDALTRNQSIIEISNLTVCYKAHKAISDLSLTVKSGEVCALLGENGAGKSTLVNAILGRIKATSGNIKVFGQVPGSYAAKLRIGTILQSANLPDNTQVEEQLNLFRSYYTNPMDMDKLLKITMLEGLQKRNINTLSGGQKQRVFFALAICGNPDIIFLDEPTVALDALARREFWRCIAEFRKSGVSIVLTTHYLEEAEALADQIVLLSQGRIRHQGSPAHIKAMASGKKLTFTWTESALSFTEFRKQVDEDIAMEKVHCDGNKIELTCHQPEALLKAIFTQGYTISDLCVQASRLEEAVLALSVEEKTLSQQDSEQTTVSTNKQAQQKHSGEAA